MKYAALLWFCAVVFLCSPALAQQSPPPTQTPGLGPYEGSGAATDFWPGDPHGAVNANWIAEKANDVIWFINRQNSSLNKKESDASFWGTNWGFASFTPRGDGRVYYDPYGPSGCATGGGRWLVSELGTMKYSDGTYQGGMVWAISQSADPTSWWEWWTADPNTRNSTICTGNNFCPSDYPQLGFNTNFIAITSHLFFGNLDPKLFIFPKDPAECSGSIPTWFNVDDPSVDLANAAETYFTNGQDLDGGTLYLVNAYNPAGGEIELSTITSAPSTSTPLCSGSTQVCSGTTPNLCYNPCVSIESVDAANGWSSFLKPSAVAPVAQEGTKVPINYELFADEFPSVVVRNHAVWAAHTIPVQPTGANPQAPTFIARAPAESEQSSGTATAKVPVPSGSKPGDRLMAVLLIAAGSQTASPSLPSGWNLLPLANVNSTSITLSGCVPLTFWAATHTYGGNANLYSFSFPVSTITDCYGNTGYSELIGYIVSYRYATSSVSAYVGTDSSQSATYSPIAVPQNYDVANVFWGFNKESNDENGIAMTWNSPSGTPALSVKTPLSVVFPFLTADLFWPGPGTTNLGQYVATQKSPVAQPPLTAFSFPLQAAPAWVAQWWQIGIDGSSTLGTQRIGGLGIGYDGLNANALDPSIAVNNEGDVLVGFSEVSPSNYLSAAYALQPASSAGEDTPYVYQPGKGPYMGVYGEERRPGDYSHTVVDPTDDFTFWTATDFAWPPLDSTVSNARGWGLTWAWVAP